MKGAVNRAKNICRRSLVAACTLALSLVSCSERTWTAAAVDYVIRDAGLSLAAGEPVRQPFMSVEGATRVGPRAEIQIFVYGDAVARARDTDALDPARVAPPTMQIMWRMPAALVVHGNVALIVLSNDPRTAERVRARLTAG